MNSNTNSIKKLYYSIGEVSKITDLKQYVLRYWETEFKQLNPNKNKAGNRTYRQKDIDLILDIKNLLYKEKFTIEGARKMLSQPQKNAKEVVKSEKSVVSNGLDKKTLVKIRNDLKSILDDLQN
jgi:DNA-binding transcriptional MerR regulator